MSEKKKERAYKVVLTGPNDATRTMEIVAESPEKAKRIALRNAEDIAAAAGEDVEPYEVDSCEAVPA